MKYQIFVFILFSSILSAHAQQEIGSGFFNYLKQDALILSEDGLIKEAGEIKEFIANFDKSHDKSYTYEKLFSKEVSSILDYEIGEIHTKTITFSVMFLKKKDGEAGPKIEFLVIYKKADSANQLSEITAARGEWMELCNAHQAGELVNRLYTTNAYYYNRGRILQGTKAITQEYGYMNNPAYSLQLTPKYVAFVSSNIVYEIGQCSGSYPNPYMLLWEKQANGNWKVLMDSND